MNHPVGPVTGLLPCSGPPLQNDTPSKGPAQGGAECPETGDASVPNLPEASLVAAAMEPATQPDMGSLTTKSRSGPGG